MVDRYQNWQSARRAHPGVVIVLILALAVVVVQSGCSKDYVTGKQTFTLIDEDDEIALGREQDAKIIAEYGLYDDENLAAYIDRIGQSLARVSQRSNLEYHFRVLDSGAVNAFALPGGYVYLPRGILAYFNSEDQLVGVMGHETGHVVARHGVEQASRQVALSGFGLTNRLMELLPVVGGLVTAPINLGLLKYSRDQESEADMLGVEYSTRTGHDAHAMADFFKTLGEMSNQEGQRIPTYLSTHPAPGERYARVNELTNESQAKASYTPSGVDPGEYLRRIDGIVYGDDPRNGFYHQNMFYHPRFRFQFPVPNKWKVSNSASRVVVIAPSDKAAVQLMSAGGQSAEGLADEYLAAPEVTRIRRERRSVNGFPATIVESTMGEGSRKTHILSHFIESGTRVLVFHGLCAEADYPTYADDFLSVMGGVAPVTDRAVLEVKPRRVRIQRAPAAGDLRSLLRALGVSEKELQEMANLNGRSLQDPVNQGDWVKIVRE
jgi:predicted Zn-dependent protease